MSCTSPFYILQSRVYYQEKLFSQSHCGKKVCHVYKHSVDSIEEILGDRPEHQKAWRGAKDNNPTNHCLLFCAHKNRNMTRTIQNDLLPAISSSKCLDGGEPVMVLGGISLEGCTALYLLAWGTQTTIKYKDEILRPIVKSKAHQSDACLCSSSTHTTAPRITALQRPFQLMQLKWWHFCPLNFDKPRHQGQCCIREHVWLVYVWYMEVWWCFFFLSAALLRHPSSQQGRVHSVCHKPEICLCLRWRAESMFSLSAAMPGFNSVETWRRAEQCTASPQLSIWVIS